MNMIESVEQFNKMSAATLAGFQNDVLEQVATFEECQSASNTVAAMARQFHAEFVQLNDGSALIDDPVKFMYVMMVQVGSATIQMWLSEKAMEFDQVGLESSVFPPSFFQDGKSELTSTDQSGIETDENIIHQEP